MSDRRIPIMDDRMQKLLQQLIDRVGALENGGAIRGRVSFDPVIQIGDVEISIVNGTGTERIVTFRNVLSGSTDTIPLA